MTKGAALAYQVAVLGRDGGGEAYSRSRGSEALVEAGMVAVLMRVAASETKSTLSSLHVKIGNISLSFAVYTTTYYSLWTYSPNRPTNPKYVFVGHAICCSLYTPTYPSAHPDVSMLCCSFTCALCRFLQTSVDKEIQPAGQTNASSVTRHVPSLFSGERRETTVAYLRLHPPTPHEKQRKC